MSAVVRMYTTPWCGYCVAAKRLLDQKKVRYENIDVSGDPDKRRWLHQVTGRTSVPQVFINDCPVGGYTDIRELDQRGELDRLLAQPPAATAANG